MKNHVIVMSMSFLLGVQVAWSQGHAGGGGCGVSSPWGTSRIQSPVSMIPKTDTQNNWENMFTSADKIDLESPNLTGIWAGIAEEFIASPGTNFQNFIKGSNRGKLSIKFSPLDSLSYDVSIWKGYCKPNKCDKEPFTARKGYHLTRRAVKSNSDLVVQYPNPQDHSNKDVTTTVRRLKNGELIVKNVLFGEQGDNCSSDELVLVSYAILSPQSTSFPTAHLKDIPVPQKVSWK